MLRLAALLALVFVTVLPSSSQGASQSTARTATFELYIDEVYDQLTGGAVIHAVAFRDPLTRQLNPPLNVTAGQSVAIKLINRTGKTRSFAIMSVAGSASNPIRAGASGVVRFKAPSIGTYIYNDPLQAGTGETRTLFGDFVVTARKD